MKDWLAWHEAYEEPGSSLARRLQVVRKRLGEVLDRFEDVRPRLLSLCAGDGCDVIPVLANRSALHRVRAVLIEKEPILVDRAQKAADSAGLDDIEIRCGDAGDVASFDDLVPVDVLMLCGVFGNLEHVAVRDVIGVVPSLVVSDGYVIWTRGGSHPDRRPEVRNWFTAAGLREVHFDGAPEPYGVGVNWVTPGALDHTRPLPDRLFTFIQS